MDTNIHMAFVVDNEYVQHLAVTCISILKNIKETKRAKFHVILDENVENENKEKLKRDIKQHGGEIFFYNIEQDMFNHLPESGHISKATYYRIFIPYILRHINDKVLYLDCDLIINDDISKIWEIDITSFFLAAVPDLGGKNRLEELGIPVNYKYFNAGVLLINMENWKLESVPEKVLEFLNLKKEKIQYHDQDGLNGVLFDKWLELNPKWNVQYNMYFLDYKDYYSREELTDALKNPYIIHFTGPRKPWHFDNVHPFRKKYYDYLQFSAWNGFRPKFSLMGLKKKIIKSIYRKIIGYPNTSND